MCLQFFHCQSTRRTSTDTLYVLRCERIHRARADPGTIMITTAFYSIDFVLRAALPLLPALSLAPVYATNLTSVAHKHSPIAMPAVHDLIVHILLWSAEIKEQVCTASCALGLVGQFAIG